MSLMERMLLVARGVEPFSTREQVHRVKVRSWRRDAKTIGNVCSCSRLFRIRRHWTDECVGPVLRMHYVNSSARRVLFPKDAEYW